MEQLAGFFPGGMPITWARNVEGVTSASEAIAVAERELHNERSKPDGGDAPDPAASLVGVSAYVNGDAWAVVFMFAAPTTLDIEQLQQDGAQ